MNTLVQPKNKNIPFCFERVSDSRSVIAAVEKLKNTDEEISGEPVRGVILEERMNECEQIHFLKYKLRDLELSLKTKNRFEVIYNKSKIVRKMFDFDFTACGLRYKGPKLSIIEEQIDKMPFIHEYCNFGGCGIELNWDMVFKKKEIVALIDKYIDDVLNYFRSEIKKLENKNNIKKEYYSRNLDLYMNLIGMTDEKEKTLVRYLFLQSVHGIYYGFKENYSKTFMMNICGITERDWKKMIVSETFNIFVCTANGRDRKKYIVPKEEVLRLVYGIEGDDQYFLDALIKKTEPNELTLKDFGHVSQCEYIKSILSNALKNRTKGINILIYGKAGTGKTELAKTLIKELGADGYEVNNNSKNNIYKEQFEAPRLVGEEKQNIIRNGIFKTLSMCLKNSTNSIIFYDEAEDYFRKNEIADQSKQEINSTLENNTTPTIWTCNELSPYWIEKSFIRRFTYTLELDKINNATLLDLVRKICIKNKVEINKKIEELIKQERPSIGLIEKCIQAYKLSGSKNIDCLYEGLKDLIYAERYANNKPKDINRNQTHDYNQNLANTDIKLDSITNGIIKSGKNDWSLILYGVSGTGKTAYAEFLGKKLGKRVIKKKVSDLQSMWVGECEHNIDNAFEEARSENAILLFDEGDCWLRDRRHNRASWETSQTNQFLQNLEAATTPVIITTNLMDSLDQAALRRFVFKVGFKYMTKSQVKEAFKTFYDIDVTDEEANISYVTPGDFAVIQKQLEYLDEKPTAAKIKELLLEEVKNKKDDFKENSMKI